jgi:hypothetical protein
LLDVVTEGLATAQWQASRRQAERESSRLVGGDTFSSVTDRVTTAWSWG